MYEIFNDLFNVGKTKSLGYLPLSTIIDYGKTIEELIEYAKINELNYILLNQNESMTASGALYLYDKKMLSKITFEFSEILINAEVPINDLDEMIIYLENNTVDARVNPLAYIVIGKMFNDKRFINVKNSDIHNKIVSYIYGSGVQNLQ